MVLGLDFKKDIAALGGIPIYLVVTGLFVLLGHLEQAYQLVLGILVLYAIAIPVRMTWFKDRPKKEMRGSDFISRFNANSLISLHAARSLIIAFVLASFFEYQIYLTIFFAALVLLVSAARMMMHRHRWEDITTGLLVGLACSIVALYLI